MNATTAAPPIPRLLVAQVTLFPGAGVQPIRCGISSEAQN